MTSEVASRRAAAGLCHTRPARPGEPGAAAGLDPAALLACSARCHLGRYRQGAEIAGQGERSDRIGIVASGLVKIVNLTERGDAQVLQILRRGHLVGLPESRASAFAWEAAVDAEVCWIPRPAWEALLCERPDQLRACLATMQRQLEDMQLWVVAMRGRSTLERVAFWLLQEAESTGGAVIPVRLTRRDLASLLDMTVETLCRQLRQLQRRRAVRMPAPDRVEIVDAARLRHLADAPGVLAPGNGPSPTRSGRGATDGPAEPVALGMR